MADSELRWAGFLVLGLALGSVHVAGCAASSRSNTSIDDDDGSSSSVGGAGGASAQGGASANGGAGMGGSTGAAMLPCGIDCSTIETNACHQAVCKEQTKQCAIEAVTNGTACDDGLYCTIDDSCQAGECKGGGSNDCDIDAPACNDVVCDESTKNCGVAIAQDGNACTATDLCITNASCLSGLCVGQAKDCFFAPVPNDCHVAACNPSNGLCEPMPGNANQGCSDPNDVCVTGKTCDNNGNCVGGQAIDCSNLTVGCVDGVCDPQTGQCIPVPVPPGGHCAEGDAECTKG
jgi:hypothetical protein